MILKTVRAGKFKRSFSDGYVILNKSSGSLPKLSIGDLTKDDKEAESVTKSVVNQISDNKTKS